MILVNEEEISVLLNDLLERYGFDFTSYARASLKRRIGRLMALDGFPSFAEFRYWVCDDPEYVTRFVEEITVNVTEMFRDPAFYKALRTEVVPVLHTYPHIRVWHAGCATGEEVYSLAILLQETGLLQKTLLYATDLNPNVLEVARKGIYPAAPVKQYATNYISSGGTGHFSDYYTAMYDHIKLDDGLKRKMIFSTHNLVSDSTFNEFQLILCRNVLIYFEKSLQHKVFHLLDGSLEPLGFLGLGSRETLRFSDIAGRYALFNNEKIWRKTA